MEFNKENFEICLCEDGSILIDEKEFVKIRNKTTGEIQEMPYRECVSKELIIPTETKTEPPNAAALLNRVPVLGKRKIISLWGEPETKMLHSLYAERIKLFTPKKSLWEHIAQEINSKFNTTFSAFQVECRYSRKKRRFESSKASSTSRSTMAYYREVEKLMQKDGGGGAAQSESGTGVMNRAQRASSESSTSSSSTQSSSSSAASSDLAALAAQEEEHRKLKKAIYDIKEQNREKRHEEKMKIIKSLADTLKKYADK